MKNISTMTAVLALSAALAVPAFAQTGAASSGTPSHPATMGQTTMGATSAASTNADVANSTYMTADSNVRASKVIGASVYNDKGQKIGTVDELLLDHNHDVTAAVLSVGGFLGIDSKLVSVKIDQLQVKPDRIVMAGATKDDLTSMPTYKYTKSSS